MLRPSQEGLSMTLAGVGDCGDDLLGTLLVERFLITSGDVRLTFALV
jgi:hypothetical protein